MFQPIKIAILDAVPRVYWSDDEGITDAQKFVDLLSPENPQAWLDTYRVSRLRLYAGRQYPEPAGNFILISVKRNHRYVFTGTP